MSLNLSEWEPPPKDSTKRIIFSWFYGHLEKLSVLRKFMQTHHALAEGHALYEETDEQLDKLKLLKPLAFNLYQSGLSAIPGIALTITLGFFFALDESSSPAASSASLFDQRAKHIFEKISPPAVAFAAPLGLLILARFAAWSSLRREQRSSSSLWKQRRAYLYFDAHYGLLPQAVLSFLISAQNFATKYPDLMQKHNVLGWLLGGAARFTSFAAFVQLVVTCSVVPSELYRLAGYSKFIHGVASGASWIGTPPKTQYVFWTACVAPVLVYAVYLVILFITHIVAFGGAWLQGVTSGAG